MQIVWKLKTVFIRDIIQDLPDPKPHYNTVATLVKILVTKGFLKAKLIGITHQYRAVIGLEDYRKKHLANIKKNYFDNSFPKMIAHFAKQEKITDAELEELIRIIKSQKP